MGMLNFGYLGSARSHGTVEVSFMPQKFVKLCPICGLMGYILVWHSWFNLS
jgi:hypothetical protein